MGKKTEIDSYSKLLYWIDCMINKHDRSKRQGLQRLRDFVEQKQTQGWKWEDIAEWAIYSTSTTAGEADPFENTGK